MAAAWHALKPLQARHHGRMATKTVTTMVDDLDGSTDGVETVELAVEGVQYRVDLSAANKQRLLDALAEYLSAASTTGGRRKRGSSAQPVAVSSDNATIRAWAQANQVDVPSRGRISAKVREQFDAANK